MLELLEAGLKIIQPQVITNISIQETSIDTFALVVHVKSYQHIAAQGWYGIEHLAHLSFYNRLVKGWGTNLHLFRNLSRSLLVMNENWNREASKEFRRITNHYSP